VVPLLLAVDPEVDLPVDGRHSQAIRKYIEKKIMGAATINLLLDTFDFIIAACRDRNPDKALKGIFALERSLDFSTVPDLARLFLIIYRHCAYLVRSELYEDAGIFMVGLRSAWNDAFNNHGAES
jgi:hypothetical protein